MQGFRVGDRVKPSEWSLRGLYDERSMWMPEAPQRALAEKWLREAKAKRATVIPTCPEYFHLTGIANGVSVVYDDGTMCHSLAYQWVLEVER